VDRLKRYGISDKILILGMTIKHIDDDKALLKVLLLCRDSNDHLRDDILKQALLRSSPHRLSLKRPHLWLAILNIDRRFTRNDYEIHRHQAISTLPKTVGDSIEVDVNRSFNNLKAIQPENLNNILKAYAVANA